MSITIGRKKPVPRNQRAELNRARQYKRNADDAPDISVSLMDMDSSIMYYFENVIKPTVFENGEHQKVPLLYASPERWYSINKTGFVRDSKRQLILPVIVFRRTGMEKDDTIAVDKIDPLDPKLFYTFERKYTDRNRYDNLSVQQGIIPQREFHNVAVPDYMVLNYDFIIYTHYIEQMNKLVERINWSAGSYWGEPGKMRFKTNIENYTDSVDVSETDRVVKTEFSVSLKGYLIPDAFNDLQGPHTNQTFLTPKRLIIGTETDVEVPSAMEQISGETLTAESSLTQLGGSLPTSNILQNQFTIAAGAGITVTDDGLPFDGTVDRNYTISVSQALDSTSSPTFNSVAVSQLTVNSPTAFSLTSAGLQNLTVTGSLIAGTDLSISGNATIGGTVTAQEFHTEYISGSIIFTSGSTQFGDTLDDTHEFTGSLQIQGSHQINGYSINEISNDANLTDTSTTALVTEFAAKTYMDNAVAAVSSYTSYLRKQFVKISSGIVNAQTASFSAVTASAPAGLATTTEDDFLFFINGQYMEHDALEIQQANASTFYVKVNTDNIGYNLESDDEIVAWGRFNS